MHRSSISLINYLLVACLGWLVVLVLVFYGSDMIYSAPASDRPAYDIAPGDAAARPQAAQTPAAPSQPALAQRLHMADSARGARIFGQCALCHTSSRDGPSRIGPNLWHVVGKPAASSPHFNYSRAMQNFAKQGHVWDFATLDAFLAAPARAVPGTIMSFAGLKDDQERADVLIYLNSLSDKPLALPDAEKVKSHVSP